MTFDGSIEMKKAFIEWLEKDAPKINNYQWKDWSEELTEKVNTNLATYTSSYIAPRTPVAKAKGVINNVEENIKPADTQVTVTVDDDMDNVMVGDISTDDDAWVDAILNG
jgi:hypothetical protein